MEVIQNSTNNDFVGGFDPGTLEWNLNRQSDLNGNKMNQQSVKGSPPLIVLKQEYLILEEKTRKTNHDFIIEEIRTSFPVEIVKNYVFTKSNNILFFFNSIDKYNDTLKNGYKFYGHDLIKVRNSEENLLKQAVIKNVSLNEMKAHQNHLDSKGIKQADALMNSKKDHEPNHFIVTFETENQRNALIDVGVIIGYVRRRVVPFNKPISVIQCYKRQKFGHTT